MVLVLRAGRVPAAGPSVARSGAAVRLGCTCCRCVVQGTQLSCMPLLTPGVYGVLMIIGWLSTFWAVHTMCAASWLRRAAIALGICVYHLHFGKHWQAQGCAMVHAVAWYESDVRGISALAYACSAHVIFGYLDNYVFDICLLGRKLFHVPCVHPCWFVSAVRWLALLTFSSKHTHLHVGDSVVSLMARSRAVCRMLRSAAKH